MSAYTWPPDPSAAPRFTPSAAEPVASAVLVPRYRSDGDTRVVLTRRRSDLRRHAGEISFPGGRRDAGDATLADTALRENNGTVNPLGLYDLDRNIRPVGREYKILVNEWRDILPGESVSLLLEDPMTFD